VETEPAPTAWRALTSSVARNDRAGPVLTEALPQVRSLTGASTALVMRRQDESWVLDLAEGEPLPTAGLVEVLREGRAPGVVGDPPPDWSGVASVACHPLPGGLTCLVLAWRGQPGPWTDPAVDLLVLGLGRLDAEERYEDLSLRVDNAQMLANMGDYDWHIETDTNRWSDQLYRIYGHEPQSFNASYERFLSFIHPDDQDWIKELHQRAYATGEPYAMTERIVRPDGEVRYLSSNGQVIMSPDGRPVRMRGTCIDITDRVLAEEDRQRSAARFRNLVESSPDAILVIDEAGSVVQANGRAHDLLGGDPVGHVFAVLVPTAPDRPDGAVEGIGVDRRSLLLDVTMADLSHLEGEEGEVAAFLHDARPRLRNESLAAALREGQLRRRQAMEINDNVVQGLSVAVYALRDGDAEVASSVLDRTLHAARQMMSDLLEPVDGGDIRPGDLVRSAPSRLGEAPA
jgi:PAS domain S-box-containing protein